jgi:hypothetical protein
MSSIDFAVIEELLEEERRQERLRWWENWVRQPAPMQVILRIGLTTYLSKPLPPEITIEEHAESFACDFATKHQTRLCLVLSRRRSIWLNANGEVEARFESTPDQPDLPLMRLVGSTSIFLIE